MHENMGSSKPRVDIEILAESCVITQHVMPKVLEIRSPEKGEPTGDLDGRTFSITLENERANNLDISITSENGIFELLEESRTSEVYLDPIEERNCCKTKVSQQELAEVESTSQTCLFASKFDLSQVAARTNYEEIISGTSSFPCELLCDSDIRNVTAASGASLSQRKDFNTTEGQYFAEVLEDSFTYRADLEVAEQRGCGESNVSQPKLPEVGTGNQVTVPCVSPSRLYSAQVAITASCGRSVGAVLNSPDMFDSLIEGSDCDNVRISLLEINGKFEEIAHTELQTHKNELDLGTSNQVIVPCVSSSRLDSLQVARSTSCGGPIAAVLNSPNTADSSLKLNRSDCDSTDISLHGTNCKSEEITESELQTHKSVEEHINTVPVDANSESTACLNAVTNIKGDDLDLNNLGGDSERLTVLDEKCKINETRHLAANGEKHVCVKLVNQGVMDMLHSNGELASSIEESSRSFKVPTELVCAQENRVSNMCVRPQDGGKSSHSLRALLSLEHTDSFEKRIWPVVLPEKYEPDSMDILHRASSAAKWSGDEHQLSHHTTNLFSGKWSDHLDMEAFTSSTFSGPVILSEAGIPYSGPVVRSGSISHRSDSSTSTRSFAFPILAGEWNSSPATMGQPTSHGYRQRKRYHFCSCCKKSSTVCD